MTAPFDRILTSGPPPPARRHERLAAASAFRPAAWLLLAAALLPSTGCRVFRKAPPTPPRPPLVQSIAKEEMVYRIVTDVQRIATLKGKCQVVAIDQSQVVPASAEDARLQARGQPFQAAFQRHTLSGVFVLDRSSPGVPPRMKFHAEVTGVMPVLEALAIADAFWVKVPNPNRGLEGMRSVLFRGRHKPGKPRSEQYFGMRPQDISDLLLSHELLPTADFHKAYTLETWPEYYILNVMRIDTEGELPWATPLYSRIWVERHNLTIALRQIYDDEGRMVAEARFTNYVSMPVRIGEERRPGTVRVPHGIRFVWPQDSAILELRFQKGDLLLNHSIPDATWRPPRDVDAIVRDLTPDADDEFFEERIEFSPLRIPDVQGPNGR